LAKNLKLNIKNTQIAEAINLGGLKSKLAKKKAAEEDPNKKAAPTKSPAKGSKEGEETPSKEEAPRIRARSKSAFAEPQTSETLEQSPIEESEAEKESLSHKPERSSLSSEEPTRMKTSAEIRKEIFGEDFSTTSKETFEVVEPSTLQKLSHKEDVLGDFPADLVPPAALSSLEEAEETLETPEPILAEKEKGEETRPVEQAKTAEEEAKAFPKPKEAIPQTPMRDKLGPTGKHVKDLLRPPKPAAPAPRQTTPPPKAAAAPAASALSKDKKVEESKDKAKHKVKPKGLEEESLTIEDESAKKGPKATKFKEFKDVKQSRRQDTVRQFDARDRQGLRTTDDEQYWRKRRKASRSQQEEIVTIRPSSLKIRTPISIKDLASEMKLKASQLISKLFLQGVVVTLNDLLEDETTIQLLGHEFGCEIEIDNSEERRIRITDQSIREELQQMPEEQLEKRPPVVAFMGHVDHGKTSLIDAIRKSNRAAGEAGAITQHIGAFRCQTSVGDIAILDTPGHEAFSAMRARGADVTDIVVLVVAGDEGLRQQSIEAIQHAKAAKVTIVVALNKCDKPNFNPETVYRQLADQELLPESWGGQTITVNCSAVTGQGIPELLEMLALQAEVLELKANPQTRARGSVLESEMHKGMGAVATVLVQNGTLKRGDSLVFSHHWGRVKTMHDEYGKELQTAGPSTPVEITGLSGLPEAGEEFIVVKSEKEAREIAAARQEGHRQSNLVLQQKKKVTMENLFQQASDSSGKKVLNLVLRADVQGSLEALRVALMKIESQKADLNIIFAGVGEISESDVQLAAASKAVIVGFHTQVESHAEALLKQMGVQVRMHDIIYHAIDDVKGLMAGLLEKIAVETEKGKAIVKATFKSSHTGIIAGCQVT
jgi:translation initiation factor IF-2